MNKNGFIRIMEAIVATIIVFGFIIIALPSEKENKPTMPYEIEQITEKLTNDLTNNAESRRCVLGIKDSNCVDILIKSYVTGSSMVDYYYEIKDPKNLTATPTESDGSEKPKDRNIYAKSITLSVDDVLGGTYDPDASSSKGYKTLTVYLWYKI